MKILIFGIPGSGKSTFANELSQKINIPVFHLDRHFYDKNWIERPHDQFLKEVKNELQKNEWIIDGNSMRSFEMRYKQANTVIYCCLPRWLCLFRVLYRRFFTLKEKKDWPHQATNKLSWKLIHYIWNFPSRFNSLIKEMRKRYPKVNFRKVTSDDELKQFLISFGNKNDN